MLNIRARRRGISLIEAVIAVTIFSIGIMYTLNAYGDFRMSVVFNKKYDESLKKIYVIKNKLYDDLSYKDILELYKSDSKFYIKMDDLNEISNIDIKNQLNTQEENNCAEISINVNEEARLEVSYKVIQGNRSQTVDTMVYRGDY